MWIMMPTNTYKQKWQPPMRARLNSTYFGAQGLIVLTFVIFFRIKSSYFVNIYLARWVPWSDVVHVGASLLVFTFPILFIAVLGSIYLHLGKDRPNPAYR